MTVVIAEEKITAVGPSTRLRMARQSKVLDGSGKFLIPALWDMHVHTEKPNRDFPLFVANGVLGVRNMAGIAKDVFQWRQDTASGKLLGPQIVACGPLIDGPDPAHPEHAIPVHSAAEGRHAVQSLKAMGADFIKVYDGVPREAYFAIADESKTLRLPFAGHVPLEVRVIEASNAGQRSLEHGAALQGGSSFEDEYIKMETNGPDVMEEAKRTNNFSLIPENIAKTRNTLLDHLNKRRLTELYKTFVRNDTYLTPTLVTLHARTFVDDISKQPDARMKYVTKSEQEAWKPENDIFSKYRTPAYIAYQRRDYEAVLKGVRLAHNLGVQVLAGTDVVAPYTYPGFSLHDELQLLVQAGLTPLEALKTATLNPAKFFGFTDMGQVARGMKANLILLDADPTKNISNTQRIFAVIMRGRLLQRHNLDELLNKAAAVASN